MAEKAKLTKSGYRRIITIYLAIVFNAVLFFVAAGRMDLPRGWAYFIVQAFTMMFIFILMYFRFPETAEVVNARGEIKMPKLWDKLFALSYALATMVLMPVIAGLDVGRYGWSELDLRWMGLGYFLFFISLIFSEWALIENKFFETGVRVQKERGQKVVSTGPYAIVRHPGYIAFIIMYASFPLIVGSVYALYASLLTAVLFVLRTALEDATLQKELDGYQEYTKKTKYRLIPFIW
jgi:protein-S-isoprenylcysteine O-methyltransferase Ste14